MTPLFLFTFLLKLARFAHAEFAFWKAFRSRTCDSNMWVVAIDSQINLWIFSWSIFSPSFNLAIAFGNFLLYFTTEVGHLGVSWWRSRGGENRIRYSAARRYICFLQILSNIILGFKVKNSFDLKKYRIVVILNVKFRKDWNTERNSSLPNFSSSNLTALSIASVYNF